MAAINTDYSSKALADFFKKSRGRYETLNEKTGQTEHRKGERFLRLLKKNLPKTKSDYMKKFSLLAQEERIKTPLETAKVFLPGTGVSPIKTEARGGFDSQKVNEEDFDFTTVTNIAYPCPKEPDGIRVISATIMDIDDKIFPDTPENSLIIDSLVIDQDSLNATNKLIQQMNIDDKIFPETPKNSLIIDSLVIDQDSLNATDELIQQIVLKYPKRDIFYEADIGFTDYFLARGFSPWKDFTFLTKCHEYIALLTNSDATEDKIVCIAKFIAKETHSPYFKKSNQDTGVLRNNVQSIIDAYNISDLSREPGHSGEKVLMYLPMQCKQLWIKRAIDDKPKIPSTPPSPTTPPSPIPPKATESSKTFSVEDIFHHEFGGLNFPSSRY